MCGGHYEHFKQHKALTKINGETLLDKVELMINLLNFLNDYEENIKVLQKYKSLKLGE
jgi:hypothetical protein